MRLSILGATGSVGTSTLDLVARDPASFEIVALTANDNVDALAAAARAHGAELAVIANPARYNDLKDALSGTRTAVAAGSDALVEAGARPADVIMASIMGAAGLRASLAAARQGTRVALANKECLVTAGDLFMAEAATAACELLPVDSEHSAVFQSIAGHCRDSIERVTLTASGGPFRTWDADKIAVAGPEAALKHPTWSMGQKITIDSATLMNKGLELIEAHYLFDLAPDELDVVVHPQSIIHCLVAFKDGSVMAQLGAPDMRTPIACALSWPTRMTAPTRRLDLAEIASLTFEQPDRAKFPALDLAMAAMRAGGTAPAILNAANEIAVHAFLGRRLPFGGIVDTVSAVLDAAPARDIPHQARNLDEILAVDAAARELARDVIETRQGH